MANIAIITARGGSKRIPRKNIKEFAGKPIIAYSIAAALDSGLFDEVMVSTDDPEIKEISLSYGAKVPFMRSEKNSDDFTGTGDAVYEVLNEYKKLGKDFTFGCCIYATAPLLNAGRLKQGYDLLKGSDLDTVFPLGTFNSPIWRSYKTFGDHRIEMNFPEHEKKRSQDLPASYFDAGQFYFFKIGQFLELQNKNTFGSKKGGVILHDIEVQDIDKPEDWEIAEFKYLYKLNKH